MGCRVPYEAASALLTSSSSAASTWTASTFASAARSTSVLVVILGRYPAIYRTLAGEVTTLRSRYRQVGAHNAKTVDPVSLRVGALADGWLPRTMAHLLAQDTSRDAVSIRNELVRIPYSRSSFERSDHAAFELYVARQESIDTALAYVHDRDETAT